MYRLIAWASVLVFVSSVLALAFSATERPVAATPTLVGGIPRGGAPGRSWSVVVPAPGMRCAMAEEAGRVVAFACVPEAAYRGEKFQ